jgi:hypothetical protein
VNILVLCSAGLNRSGSMLRVLKKDHLGGGPKGEGIDALNAGLHANSKGTLQGLMGWADRIVVMDANLAPLVGPENGKKIVLADVGPDIWGSPTHPDLLGRCKVIAEQWAKDGWKMASLRLRPKPEEAAVKG